MSGVGDPARHAATVAPSNTVDLPLGPARSLYIGVSGDVAVIMYPDGESALFSNVPVGILPVQVKRVLVAGTTASFITALW